MNTTSLLASASRFAHFAGLTRSSRRASEDDDEPAGKRGKAEDDDDGKDASEDDDADGDDGKPAGKRGRKAEGDDDGKDASEDDDADDDDDMKGKGAVAQARRREQARIAHILGHKAAANNPVLAVTLACETRMTRKEAVAVLRSNPAGHDQGDNRHARSDRQSRNAKLGNEASAPTGKQAIDASWGAAFEKAGTKVR